MTTLTIAKARANLSELLERAKRGEDIGIVSGDQVVALRPVTVSSDDYVWREYGATPAVTSSRNNGPSASACIFPKTRFSPSRESSP
jgi:prevent-host-death family protein